MSESLLLMYSAAIACRKHTMTTNWSRTSSSYRIVRISKVVEIIFVQKYREVFG